MPASHTTNKGDGRRGTVDVPTDDRTGRATGPGDGRSWRSRPRPERSDRPPSPGADRSSPVGRTAGLVLGYVAAEGADPPATSKMRAQATVLSQFCHRQGWDPGSSGLTLFRPHWRHERGTLAEGEHAVDVSIPAGLSDLPTVYVSGRPS